MRTVLMALMIARTKSTVGVYTAVFGSTPTAKSSAGDYGLTVTVGSSTGTPNYPSSGSLQRTGTVTISSTEASTISTANLVIYVT